MNKRIFPPLVPRMAPGRFYRIHAQGRGHGVFRDIFVHEVITSQRAGTITYEVTEISTNPEKHGRTRLYVQRRSVRWGSLVNFDKYNLIETVSLERSRLLAKTLDRSFVKLKAMFNVDQNVILSPRTFRPILERKEPCKVAA